MVGFLEGLGFGSSGGAGGGSSLSPTLITRGAQILSAANSFVKRTYMATAPVMLLGAAGAVSSINGAGLATPVDLVSDATKFAKTAPTGPNSTWGEIFRYSSQSGADRNSAGGIGNGYARYVVNCSAFDISIYSGGSLARNVRIRVNGEWAQDVDYVTEAFSARRYLKFTFAVPVTGLIEIFVDSTLTVMGMNFAADSASLPDTSNDIRAEMWGDSYMAGGGAWATSIWSPPLRLFMEAMGVRNPVPQGRAGQGWDATVDSRTILDRMVLDIGYALPDPHFAGTYVSVNDRGNNIAAAASRIAQAVQLLQATYPNSWIPVFFGFDTAVSGFAAGDMDAMFAAVAAVADNRTLLLDGRSWDKVANSGTLPTRATHDSSDTVHPGDNESAYFWPGMKSLFIGALQAKLS